MPTSTSSAKSGRGKDGVSHRNGDPSFPSQEAQPAATNNQSPGASRPSDEAIAQRAYEIYEREGRQQGQELENWLKAEAELYGPNKRRS